MNPQMIISNIFKQNPAMQHNPIMQNAFQMARNNDIDGLQSLVKNVAQAKGVDINQLIQQTKQQFGL